MKQQVKYKMIFKCIRSYIPFPHKPCINDCKFHRCDLSLCQDHDVRVSAGAASGPPAVSGGPALHRPALVSWLVPWRKERAGGIHHLWGRNGRVNQSALLEITYLVLYPTPLSKLPHCSVFTTLKVIYACHSWAGMGEAADWIGRRSNLEPFSFESCTLNTRLFYSLFFLLCHPSQSIFIRKYVASLPFSPPGFRRDQAVWGGGV